VPHRAGIYRFLPRVAPTIEGRNPAFAEVPPGKKVRFTTAAPARCQAANFAREGPGTYCYAYLTGLCCLLLQILC
jgi:hypothetical protein